MWLTIVRVVVGGHGRRGYNEREKKRKEKEKRRGVVGDGKRWGLGLFLYVLGKITIVTMYFICFVMKKRKLRFCLESVFENNYKFLIIFWILCRIKFCFKTLNVLNLFYFFLNIKK